MRERRDLAGAILTNAKPPVDDDVVYVHVSAEGTIGDRLRRREFVRAYYPIEIGGMSRTAIAWTTSASVVAVMEMVRDGKLAGHGFSAGGNPARRVPGDHHRPAVRPAHRRAARSGRLSGPVRPSAGSRCGRSRRRRRGRRP